jgi:hypothetical protein
MGEWYDRSGLKSPKGGGGHNGRQINHFNKKKIFFLCSANFKLLNQRK